jgi:hypothetical protein
MFRFGCYARLDNRPGRVFWYARLHMYTPYAHIQVCGASVDLYRTYCYRQSALRLARARAERGAAAAAAAATTTKPAGRLFAVLRRNFGGGSSDGATGVEVDGGVTDVEEDDDADEGGYVQSQRLLASTGVDTKHSDGEGGKHSDDPDPEEQGGDELWIHQAGGVVKPLTNTTLRLPFPDRSRKPGTPPRSGTPSATAITAAGAAADADADAGAGVVAAADRPNSAPA